MKKGLKFFACSVLISCIIILIYLLGANSSQDDIVFEFSYSDECLFSEYYALKRDNTLIWVYGYGRMGNFTYGTFFSDIDEQGFVKVSDEDVKEMKRCMKKVLKYYASVPSNASIRVHDAPEIILKCKNKYYNYKFLKKKYEYESEYTYFGMYDMREKLKEYVEKYREQGAYVYYD